MSGAGRIIVVGGGISGLATAYWLDRAGIDVQVLEQDVEPGGTIRTVREGEWLIETGPNTALETTPLLGEMFDDLGIAGQRVYANPSSDKRYILRSGRLRALPMSAGTFIASTLWSWPAKLRLLKEPFIGRGVKEESVAEFVQRRLGREFLDYAINPFVAGVYAGNPEQLSVRAAFPKLYALEEKYGGLVRGMVLGRRERRKREERAKDRARLFSFVGGMQTFPEALATRLGTRLRLASKVTSIVRSPASGGEGAGGFLVSMEKGGRASTEEARAVVLSVPAFAAAGLVRPTSRSLATMLEDIYYPPVAEIYLGFREDQFRRSLDGFGFLVPSKEQRSILGTIWSTSLFPARAPRGHVALTTFVGGARQPDVMNKDDAELVAVVTGEVRSIMGGTGEPVFSRVTRWQRAIPQYNLGYSRVSDAMNTFETELPGFFLCSNFRGGIAVGDCVMNAKSTAERVRRMLFVDAEAPGSMKGAG